MSRTNLGESYWRLERWRFALVLFLAFLIGLISGWWFAGLSLALLGYIAWLLFKLRQLYLWLEKGGDSMHLPDSDGIWERIIHQIQGMQKKSDKRKRRMAKLLKRFQGIISGLPYATVVLNSNNEIDWANKLSAEYLNIIIKKDRGQRIENLIRLPELHKALEKDSRKEIEITLAHSGRKLALQLIPAQSDLKLLIARDVSERENIMTMRKNFIANASHELRTPLTVIAGYLEMMEEEELPEHIKEAIASSSEQSSRMTRIIEDLLTLSRLENSELNKKSSETIDVSVILQGICKDEASLIRNNSHQLKTDIQTGLSIEGSKVEMISVLTNLIHNAIRHTQDGTTVTVTWKQVASGEACLVVKDDGQGIAEEHIIHLTERFYRVDKGRSRDKGGTGLGLAIVQHIIQRHGGNLTVESTVSKGSTFTACFPADKVSIPN